MLSEPAVKKRPWYRLHFATWLMLPILGAAMVYSGIGYYSYSLGIRRHIVFDLGWPFQVCRWSSGGFDEVSYSAIAVNAVVFVVLAAATALFVEMMYYNPGGRAQLKLGTLLIVIGAFSLVLGVTRMEIPQILTPLVVALFIFIAMFTAATYSLERGLKRISKRARVLVVLLLAVVLFVAAAAAVSSSASEYLALTHWAEHRIPRRYDPDVFQRMSVMPIGLSLACAVYVSGRLSVWLTRRFLTLVR